MDEEWLNFLQERYDQLNPYEKGKSSSTPGLTPRNILLGKKEVIPFNKVSHENVLMPIKEVEEERKQS
mgnify:CR=1 FL=1